MASPGWGENRLQGFCLSAEEKAVLMDGPREQGPLANRESFIGRTERAVEGRPDARCCFHRL